MQPETKPSARLSMTRFLYLADTHLGAAPMGYQQQPGFPERLAELVAALRRYIEGSDAIDFVLHGGDLVDQATDASIVAAADVFALPVPMYLCLGNHDLTRDAAVSRWLALAPRFFGAGTGADYSVVTDDVAIHVVPTQWEEQPYRWSGPQREQLTDGQECFLETALRRTFDRSQIVLTHSPVLGLPPAQTGFPEPYHAPGAGFARTMLGLAARHPSVACVLGAHTHMNQCVREGRTAFVTASAFVEAPFEIKRFEATATTLTMETVRLGERIDWTPALNPDHPHVQGRPADRAFTWHRGILSCSMGG